MIFGSLKLALQFAALKVVDILDYIKKKNCKENQEFLFYQYSTLIFIREFVFMYTSDLNFLSLK
jgi:hypothetical protein